MKSDDENEQMKKKYKYKLSREDVYERPSCCGICRAFWFYFYDQVSFFGFAHHKL